MELELKEIKEFEKNIIFQLNFDYEVLIEPLFNLIKKKQNLQNKSYIPQKIILKYVEELINELKINNIKFWRIFLSKLCSKANYNIVNYRYKLSEVMTNKNFSNYNNIDICVIDKQYVHGVLKNGMVLIYNNYKFLKHTIENISEDVSKINKMFRNVEKYYRYINNRRYKLDLDEYKKDKILYHSSHSFNDIVQRMSLDYCYLSKFINKDKYKTYYKLFSHPKVLTLLYKKGIIPYKGYFNSSLSDISVFCNIENKIIIKMINYGINIKSLHSIIKYYVNEDNLKLNFKFDKMDNELFEKILYQLNYDSFDSDILDKLKNKISLRFEFNKTQEIFNFIKKFE